MSTHRARPSKGVVLIVVLGILVVLALLATTFATLQRIDRTVSRNYMDDVRAKLLAQSGVDYAVTQIRGMMQQGMFNSSSGTVPWWTYWGNDTGETGATPSLLQAPIEIAKNPSWALESTVNPFDPAGTPKQINIIRPDSSTIQVGLSGTMDSGTYTTHGDIYTLKCTDTSGTIYVNDGVYQYNGNNSTVSQNLRRMLNVLGQHSTVGITGLGNMIIDNRPPTGYTSKYELRKAVSYNDALFNKFKDYVSTNAWVDKNVVNPVPLSDTMLPQYYALGAPSSPSYYRGGSTSIMRRGRGMNAEWVDRYGAEPLQWYQPGMSGNNYNAIYGQDELFPSYIEVVWRAPVNVNSATEPVLTALIAGVTGFFSIERRRNRPYSNSPGSFFYDGPGFMGTPIGFTIPQNYYTWWYSRYSYDNQRYSNVTTSGSNALTSDPGAAEGDESGLLYRTVDFVGPGGTATGVSAVTIAQAIIQCRSNSGIYLGKPFAGQFKTWAQFYAFLDFLVQNGVIADGRGIYGDYLPSPAVTGTDSYTTSSADNAYASQAAADALKANFNPNCHLNCTNPDKNLFLLVDKTSLIVNSTELCFTPMGYYELESLGRVLRPMEAGASGTGTSVDAFSSAGNYVMAEKKMLVEVKIFDAYRESTQRHFYNGTLYNRQSAPETSNNMSLEIGPEVDNGPLVYGDNWSGYSATMTPVWDGCAQYPTGVTTQPTGWGYEYDGYVALPTLGGNWNGSDMTGTKPKGTLWTTASGTPKYGDAIEVHFTYDFKARYHASAFALGQDNLRDCVTIGYPNIYATTYIDQLLYTKPPKISRTMNFPSRGEINYRPYCAQEDLRYRLARSFRMPLQPSGSGSGAMPPPPSLAEFAPSDLRIDGGYSERNDGIAYWMDQGYSWNEQAGVMAAWIKPSFFPEHSGKCRKVFGMSRWHAKNFEYRNPIAWDVFYFPAQDTSPYTVSGTESMSSTYYGGPYSTGSDSPVESVGGQGVYPFRPMSFNSIWSIHCYTGALADVYDEGPWLEEENYACTPSLNHRLHPSEATKPNWLDKARWAHVIFTWHEVVGSYVNTSHHSHNILIDGQVPAGESYPFAGTIFDSTHRWRYYTIQSFADSGTGRWLTNTIRLGECSNHGFGSFNRNFSGDMTFDEFYVWTNNSSSSMSAAQQLWQWGRYYKPQTGNYSDATFLSASINLYAMSTPRYLAPPSTTATPPITTGSSSSSVSTTTTASSTGSGKRRLLGVAWTWFAEDYAQTSSGPGVMVPIMYDYVNPNAPATLYQTDSGGVTGNPQSICRVFIIADGTQFPLSNPNGFVNDGWSPIVGSDGKPYTVTNPQNIQYKLWFQIKGLMPSSILLATPYFDDITLYYDSGDVEFLLYALVNTV